MIRRILDKIIGDARIEVKPPDIIVWRRNNVYVTRYLIGREADTGLYDLDEASYRSLVDKYAVIINRLPPGSEIKIVKVRTDLGRIVSRITNEILNLKATIETVEEEHVKRKAEARLKILEKLYEDILRGKPIDRILFVVKIHSLRNNLADALEELDLLASTVKTLVRSMLGLELREPGRRELMNILKYELGLTSEPGGKQILVNTGVPARLLPLPVRKKPLYEKYDKAIPIGIEIETGWPVLLPVELLNRHVALIGPTGKGKTTLLALIIESLTSLDETNTVVIDFKGDLAKIINRDLIDVVYPSIYPFNILVEPPGMSRVDWLLAVTDTLHNVLGYDREKTSILLGKKMGKPLGSPEQVIIDRELSFFTPIVEFLTSNPRYSELINYFSRNVLFDLGGSSNVYRNTYGGLLIHMYKHYATTKMNDKLKLLIIDEAWRVSRLNGLLELVKEGRSRGVGVVLAVQNPSDLPREILENTHIIIMFGSQNEDYQKQAMKILGVKKSTASKLKYLGVGEAIMINTLDPHPVLIRVNKPSSIDRAMMNGGLT